eukprot:1170841-Rhodomonas_salina.1
MLQAPLLEQMIQRGEGIPSWVFLLLVVVPGCMWLYWTSLRDPPRTSTVVLVLLARFEPSTRRFPTRASVGIPTVPGTGYSYVSEGRDNQGLKLYPGTRVPVKLKRAEMEVLPPLDRMTDTR